MRSKQIIPLAVDIISRLELKLLVRSIINKRAKIGIKCLLEGGKWSGRFFSVMMVTENGLVLSDDSTDKITSIKFIDQVVQFVIDKPFDNYNPGLAYVVG